MAFSTRGFSDEEEIRLQLHPHWLQFVKPGAIVFVGLVLSIASTQISDSAAWYETVLTYPAFAIAALGFVQLVGKAFSWVTTHYVVTNERVIFQRGVFGRQRLEIPLQRVNNVVFEQSFFERILNAGDLIVESGAGDRDLRFELVPSPEVVQSVIQRASIKRTAE
jgi:uncharacterized membrane protein YdbT with pleckstrin-like domain